jgi:hypothetical protein
MRYAAERRNLDESIEELRQIADGRNDILAEAAGISAGSWYAWPSTHVGHELIAAGMLIMAGGGNGTPLDHGELERWTRGGYERGMSWRKGERWVKSHSGGTRGLTRVHQNQQNLIRIEFPRPRRCPWLRPSQNASDLSETDRSVRFRRRSPRPQ